MFDFVDLIRHGIKLTCKEILGFRERNLGGEKRTTGEKNEDMMRREWDGELLESMVDRNPR